MNKRSEKMFLMDEESLLASGICMYVYVQGERKRAFFYQNKIKHTFP